MSGHFGERGWTPGTPSNSAANPTPRLIRSAAEAEALPVGSLVAAITLDNPVNPAVAHKVSLTTVDPEGVGSGEVWRMVADDSYWTSEELWPADYPKMTRDGTHVHSVVLLWRPEWAVLLVRPNWAGVLEIPE